MHADHPTDPLLRPVLDSLDPGIASPHLARALVARLRALEASDGATWAQDVLAADRAEDPSTLHRLRTIVGHLLYERGLTEDRVGPTLAPHLTAWSPAPESAQLPLDLTAADLASPETIEDSYDVIVIGSGAGGGMAAQTLAEAGWRTLIVERGRLPERSSLLTEPLRTPRAGVGLFTNVGPGPDSEIRRVEVGERREEVTAAQGLWSKNAMTIGGGTRVYGAQAWRLAPEDFAMASTYGVPGGSALADWPIGYDALEPFYARVETMLGVSGTTGHDPWEGPRSAPLPMGPLAPSPLTGLLAGAAERLGFGTQPVPLLVNSRPHGGRAACSRCAQCVGFDCPVRARAGSHNTTLPRALASGNATLLPGAQAARILVDAAGRARSVDLVGEKGGRIWRRTVGAGTVVLAAGAIESARLLLDSACDAFPGGLGNAHDQVGRHLQGHAYGGASALFAEEVVDLRGPGPSISTADFRHGNDGVIGGGILADEFVPTPASTHQSLRDTGLVPPTARLGSPEVEGAMLRFARIVGPIQEVTSSSSRVRIDAGFRDRLGRSTVRLSGSLHPEDLRGREMLTQRAAAWLREAGAVEVQPMGPIGPDSPPSAGQHQAGTCRMGTDPRSSVVGADGRVWGHENIVVADGSTHVTNGGVNPVLTILANALRISDGVVRAG
ncbi:GMC oxidoreductase [Brachybacterium sp. AOP24-D1-21]|uniref:GMC oxidoreductase n=1 Tax=Brachybacterium sp. AOP24-D1-21 TaxID=3457711 RepID=UPI004034BB90